MVIFVKLAIKSFTGLVAV